MLVDPERRRLREGVDRSLEPIVAKGFHPSAVAAHEVVMVIAARLRGLELCSAGAEIEAVDEPELRQGLERTVDARKSDSRSSQANLLMDRGRREAATLVGDDVDHGSSGGTRLDARFAQDLSRVLGPGHRGRMIPVLILM